MVEKNIKEVTHMFLFDRKKMIYYAGLDEQERPKFTDEKDKAFYFEDGEERCAWHMAYKMAWLGLGKFFLHGESEEKKQLKATL